MTLDYKAIDVDNHYYETIDSCTRHLPKEFKRRGVQMLTEGKRTYAVMGGEINQFIPNPTFDPIIEPGCLDLLFRGEIPEGVDPASLMKVDRMANHPEYQNRDARVTVMDGQNLETVFMLPTFACGVEEALKHDIDATMATVHAFNLWLDEDWGFDRPDHRIISAPIISLADPDAAKDEVEFVLARGAKMVLVRPAPVPGVVKPRSLGDPIHDPVWARLAEAGVPVGFHLSDSGYLAIAAQWGGQVKFEGFGKKDPLDQILLDDRAIHDSMASMIVHQVFTRHPKLKVVSIENGSYFVYRLIKRLKKSANTAPHHYKVDPVEQIRNNVWIAPYYEDDVKLLAATIGVDKVLFGSDWPHGEGLADPMTFTADIPQFPEFSADDTRKVMRDNALALLGTPSMGEWTIGDVVDAIADVIPDRTMTVCGERRTTFGELAARTRRLANFLADKGFGAHQERAKLENWECGQDRVALVMYNDRYPEMVVGCLKARTVPFNVNHNYAPHEVADLLDYVKPRVVIYHRSLGEKFADVLLPGADLLISVDDGSDAAELPGATALDDALAQGDPDRRIAGSPDDLIMYCTGGTTGRPKGVLWRQADSYVSSMVGADHAAASEIHAKVTAPAGAPWFAVSPLMHAAGIWTAFSAVLAGQTVVLYDDRAKFNPQNVLETAEREKIGLMTMVGDAYAAPLAEEMGRRDYDLSSMYAIGTGGAATNPKHQAALLKHLPQIVVINGYGSSETGNMGFGHSKVGTQSETFILREGGTVASEDFERFLVPGEDIVGWVVRTGRIPLGYFDDAEATRKTFPEIDGQRVVVSGDRASLEADGTLRLFGRDSLIVNTGGEKVFVEEVEAVLRAHPAVADALVVGRGSERWGQEVVALVELHPGAGEPSEALAASCTAELARFKAPKEYVYVDKVRRLGNGKADYRWAKSEAVR